MTSDKHSFNWDKECKKHKIRKVGEVGPKRFVIPESKPKVLVR